LPLAAALLALRSSMARCLSYPAEVIVFPNAARAPACRPASISPPARQYHEQVWHRHLAVAHAPHLICVCALLGDEFVGHSTVSKTW
jgi:hypothetical protein